MDAVTGTLTWPLHTAIAYMRFAIGAVILVFPLLFRVLIKGKKSLRHFDDLFSFMSSYPLGIFIFSGIISFYAPYTASISPIVQHLDKSTCTVMIKDRPWLRNPFSSIHAIALSNLGEVASGLAMVTSLQYHPHLRGIPTQISTEYYHKARGTLIAKGSVPIEILQSIKTPTQVKIYSDIYDSTSEDLVLARTTVVWSISMKTEKADKKNK